MFNAFKQKVSPRHKSAYCPVLVPYQLYNVLLLLLEHLIKLWDSGFGDGAVGQISHQDKWYINMYMQAF